MRNLAEELEPYVAMFDEGFVPADETVADPKKKVYKACTVGTYLFNKITGEKRGEYEDMEYWPKSDAKMWWTDGMQKNVADEVCCVSDGDDHVYVFYDKMNNSGYTTLLGRLKIGSLLDRMVKDAFNAM